MSQKKTSFVASTSGEKIFVHFLYIKFVYVSSIYAGVKLNEPSFQLSRYTR